MPWGVSPCAADRGREDWGGREHNAVPVEAVALLRGNSASGMTPQRVPSRVKAKSLSPRLFSHWMQNVLEGGESWAKKFSWVKQSLNRVDS